MIHPNHFLWISQPNSFDRDSSGRLTLRVDDDWWNCDQRTRTGDLALVYCTAPESAIVALFEATTDARRDQTHPYPWICNIRQVQWFKNPAKFQELSTSKIVGNWTAYREKFRGSSFVVPTPVWDELVKLLQRRNLAFALAGSATPVRPVDQGRMQLRQAILHVLEQYPGAIEKQFAAHPVAQFMRQQFPDVIRAISDRAGDYLVTGSAGQGNWTKSPWVAIFDPLITDSAQRGFYPVYLFREDFSGLYLSLNQGVTDVRLKYRLKAKDALRARGVDFRARLGPPSPTFPEVDIDLKPASQSNLSTDYEAGNIVAIFYGAQALPEESALTHDLLLMLSMYSRLTTSDPDLDSAAIEDDEQDNKFEEDHSKMRAHKRIERNPNVSKAVKKAQGYICIACGFDFRTMYPGIEQNEYIEAHHLIPISQLKGQKVSRNPETDFAVLCANCHRMIHRCASTSDIEAFKQMIKD